MKSMNSIGTSISSSKMPDWRCDLIWEPEILMHFISILTRSSIDVLIFISLIISYFSFLSFAFTPYHGRPPLRKYMRTKPRHSRSSLRLCSIPMWVFRLAYLAVPVRLFPSLYGMCWPVLASLYLLVKPKSTIYT